LRIALRLAAALAVGVVLAPPTPEATAATCPRQTFLSFGRYAYVARTLPASVGIEPGAKLGRGVLDEPTSSDGCKRRTETITLQHANGIDELVAVVASERRRTIFLLGSRCNGFEGAERWPCLLQPVLFGGRRYTGVRYPASSGRRRTVPLGRRIGRARAAGRPIAVVRIRGVSASLAIGVSGRPHDAYVAPGVCPYERFDNRVLRDDLRRCLEGPVWYVFDPPGAPVGGRVVGVADRPVPAQLAGATVSLVRLPLATDIVPTNRSGSVSLGPARREVALTVPELRAGLYEAVVSCPRCAASHGGKTLFPAGSFLVSAEAGRSTGVRAVSVGLAAAVLILAAASLVVWRRRRRLRPGATGAGSGGS
jgi:hypothetical protein